MEDIIKNEDGTYSVNGYEYFDKEELKAEIENAKLLYKPEFIPFYLKEVKEYGFSNTEGLIYGFMRFYLANNPHGQFYFTNEQLAYMLDISPRTVSGAINKVLDCGEFKATYKIRTNGGTFRLVEICTSKKPQTRLAENCKSDWQKPASQTSRNLLPNNNNIKENNKTISKDIGKSVSKKKNKPIKEVNTNISKTTSYGNGDINTCIEYLKEKVGGQLDGTEKSNRQYCYNLLRKIKKGYPDLNTIDQIKIVIDIATADPFHSKNATSFKYLFYNFVKIVKQAKENTNRVVEIK